MGGPPVTISSSRTQLGTDEIGMHVSDDSSESKSAGKEEERSLALQRIGIRGL